MLKATPIPMFESNYCWCLHQPHGPEVWVIDPGDASPVIKYLQQHQLHLKGIIITHTHRDHIGGIDTLIKHHDIPVLGPLTTVTRAISHPLYEGDQFALWDASVATLAMPGHMPEHLCFLVRHQQDEQLFCGDVLFSAGCGRIFHGTHKELKTSLDRIKNMAPKTLIYCAHEYTEKNLLFAQMIEPNNKNIQERYRDVCQLRQQNLPSLPTHLALELTTNPFLRCDQSDVVSYVTTQLGNPSKNSLEVFTALRQWKDKH